MSTRTTGKREGLRERVGNRMFVIDEHERGKHMYHIRAELQRVARQVRKLKSRPGHKLRYEHATAVWQHNEAIDLVLALIRKATR